MAEETDKGDRTEEPTAKRIEDARKEGQVPSSRDVTSFLILALALFFVSPFGAWTFEGLVPSLGGLFGQAHLIGTDEHAVSRLMLGLLLAVGLVLAPPLLGFALAAILSSLAQHGVVVSMKPVTPAFSKISPLSGLKRLFGPKSLAEFAKNVAKIGLVGAAAWWAVGGVLAGVPRLAALSPLGGLAIAQDWVMRAAGAGLVVVLVVALADYALQRHTHWQNLKMTRQQVRDEQKQTDGDPHVKAKIRQLRSDRARQRMMQAVPEATVVVTNPTHFAVALRYEPGATQAPEVVAKGADELAFRIRALAREHGVPVIENRTLARALFADVEVGRSIPRKHFEAVAEVIGFVLRRAETPGS